MYSNEKRRWLLINKRNKGQVTIFIIIAIIIVGLAILFYFIIPGAEVTTVFDEKNPNTFIQACLEDKIEDTVELISLQGGSIVPEHYFTYNDINIEYLCYTNKNVGEVVDPTCVIQQPLLKQHIESEIENEIREDVVTCFNALKESYEEKNYNVNLGSGITTVELLPKRVVASFNYVLTVSRAQTDRYDSFSVILNNNLYELISIANSIIEWEVVEGKADPRIYMALYNDFLRVDRIARDDGTNIYILTDKNTEDKFQLASRSLVFLPGH
jgi:hypothetical protein